MSLTGHRNLSYDYNVSLQYLKNNNNNNHYDNNNV